MLPFLLILVQLGISWLILWYLEKGNLSFLGLKPNFRGISDFFLFLFISTFFSTLTYILKEAIGKEVWHINPNLNLSFWLEGVGTKILWVFTEEMLFRGVLFYMVWRKWNALTAIFISSTLFGMYHWVTFNIIGQYGLMLKTFFPIFSLGFIYGYGYVISKSLYSTLGMHFGYVITIAFLFAEDPAVQGVFVLDKATEFHGSGMVNLVINLLPLLLNLLVCFLILRLRNQEKRKPLTSPY